MIDFWFYFWTFDFVVAGTAFAFILVVVAIRGFSDLLAMFRLLEQESKSN